MRAAPAVRSPPAPKTATHRNRSKRLKGAILSPSLCSLFSNFRFGVPETGLIVDGDRFVEHAYGAVVGGGLSVSSF